MLSVREALFNGSIQHVFDVADGVDKLIFSELFGFSNKSRGAYSSSASSSSASSGGHSFNVLILNLFDRLFGEEVTKFGRAVPSWNYAVSDWIALTSGIVEDSDRALLPLASPMASSSSASGSAYTGIGARGGRIIDLLAPSSRFFEALLRANWVIQMSLDLLPEKAQLRLLESKEYPYMAAPHHMLYENLMKLQHLNKPARTENGDIVLQVDVLVYFLASFFRYAAAVDRDFVRLSVPTAPASSSSSSSSGSRLGGNGGSMSALRRSQTLDPEHPSGLPAPDVMYSAPISRWKQGVVYLTLLEKYLEFFFPATCDALTNQSELFLWLAIDYWIDTAMVINRDMNAIAPANQGLVSRTPTSMLRPAVVSSALKSCSEVLLLDFGKNHLPPSSALESAYMMLCHVQRAAAASASSSKLVVSIAIGEKQSLPRSKANRKIVYALPRALEILQQPIFDLLRACFASFDGLKQQQQLMVLALWLRWIQPWKYVDSEPDKVNIFGLSAAVYSSEWRPYVALNMHFYTSLFVSFMKASMNLRGLDGRSSSSTSTATFGSPPSSAAGFYYQAQQQSASAFGSTSGAMDASISSTLWSLVDAVLDVYQPAGGIALFEDLDALYAAVQVETPGAVEETSEIHSVFRKSFMGNTPASSQKALKSMNIDSPANFRSLNESLQKSPMNLAATPVGVRSSARQREIMMSAETPQSRRRFADSPGRGGRFGASILSPGGIPSAVGGSKAGGATGWSGSVGADDATYYPADHMIPVTSLEVAAIMKTHRVLFPDESVPLEWAAGTLLRNASEDAFKLENLALKSGAKLGRVISDKLRRISGLLASNPFESEYSEPTAAPGTPEVSRGPVRPSPERYMGSGKHGLLTPAGKEEFLSGKKKFKPNQVKYIGDLMSAPLCSYEVPGLVRLAIAASRALNARFDLPADKDSVRLTWKEIITISRAERMSKLPPFASSRLLDADYWVSLIEAWKALLNDLAAAFRFNLRVFCDRELWLLVVVQIVVTFLVYKFILIVV